MASEALPQSDLHRRLSFVDESGVRCTRFLDDASRLWKRIGRFLAMGLSGSDIDRPALELACMALQLPLRQSPAPAGRQTAVNLRERAEQAAVLLLSGFARAYEAKLLQRTADILRDLPRKAPASEEARLLADAVNLDDFGAVGLMNQALHLARAHGSTTQLVEAAEKREEYGYWDARIKNGFHHQAVRELARQRLEHSRKITAMLAGELQEDDL